MKIAIDLRSLSSGSVSGVENYTLNLLDYLLKIDRENTYVLFFNSFFKVKLPEFGYVNAKVKFTRWPNKLLNFLFKFRLISLEKLIGNFDVLFMPNLNQFNINTGAKLALTVHDLSPLVTPEFYDFKRRVWHYFLNYEKAFNRADVIFAVSEYTKNDLLKLFSVKKDKIKVIYPGIDQKIFNTQIPVSTLRDVRNKYSLPGDYILFLNTIEPRKNLSNLIKAFENVSEPYYLVIAGKKGWKYSQLFKEVKNSRKNFRIKYLGYLPEEDKPAVIKLAKMLVYPSFYEGFGFQPLEALFCGTPAIVSNVTSLPEIVGKAGYLVNPYNISEIQKSIEALIKNEGSENDVQMDVKNLNLKEKYDWQLTAKQTLNEIKLICQK